MKQTKTIYIERKDNEGCVIETENQSVEVSVNKKRNGRIHLKINVPSEGNVNVYRIDSKGVPENKRTKECNHERFKEINKVRPI